MITVGRIVHVTLNPGMVEQINTVRKASSTTGPGFFGNAPIKDDVLAAMIVRVFPGNGTTVNLQVFTDGNHAVWFTSVPFAENPTPGYWHWPQRSPE